jgi:hypothetical protein
MTDSRVEWKKNLLEEKNLIIKHIFRKMIDTYQQDNFKFSAQKKINFHVVNVEKLSTEEGRDFAKFVYWSLLQYFYKEKLTMQDAHSAAIHEMQLRLDAKMISYITSGFLSDRTVLAMQNLGIVDEALGIKPIKINKLAHTKYTRHELKKNETGMDPEKFDDILGHSAAIKKMADLYQAEIDEYKMPLTLGKINLKSLCKHADLIRDIFYPLDQRKAAKWIYWNLLNSYYEKRLLIRDKEQNLHSQMDSAQHCHMRVMDAIEKILGKDFAAKIFAGGSWFGQNRTVQMMKDIGIMDDRKYPGLIGMRCCTFAKVGKYTPVIFPSNKEWSWSRDEERLNLRKRYRP